MSLDRIVAASEMWLEKNTDMGGYPKPAPFDSQDAIDTLKRIGLFRQDMSNEHTRLMTVMQPDEVFSVLQAAIVEAAMYAEGHEENIVKLQEEVINSPCADNC